MAYMKRKRSVKKGKKPYRKRSTVPRDIGGISECIKRVDSDVYTTTLTSLFTSNGVFTKNASDATMFYFDLDGVGIFNGSRGFTHLSDRFQLFMLHWMTCEVNLGSSLAGANHQIMISYQPALGGQFPVATPNIGNLENSGARLRSLNQDNCKTKWTMTGIILNESYANSLQTGYTFTSPYKTYMATNQASGFRIPTVRFGHLIAYSPGIDITAAQPGQLTITFRFKVSFAVPSQTTN